ncbi:dihydroneopterin aldolase [Aliarcobacter vitoriensis]|uniref:dihydroneopterin aldolase n=1 Tax=Aliarcobacter vitoriensis TaxID=2011099 RepID=A0A366MTR3_9BACT|nr:dihydroneopterin aldolase [Aliarcobacter vitoriensis]RBQ28879.1 dihydroneopterin aldolase [Aliarcobacter vitoriensis]RBQ31065.1 dihydroneopterin aldolase [Arcobacter sp. FW59]
MKIEIENLTFKCIIGILNFERVKKQKVILNISFEYDFVDNSFIDYSEVSILVKKTMKKEKFELLEDAIKTIEKLLYDTYDIKNLKLKISKPNILKDCVVSLSS